MCSYHTLQTAKHDLLFNWGIDSNAQHMQILNHFIWIFIRKGTHCSNPHDRIYHSFNISLLNNPPPPQHPLSCLQRKENIKGKRKKEAFLLFQLLKRNSFWKIQSRIQNYLRYIFREMSPSKERGRNLRRQMERPLYTNFLMTQNNERNLRKWIRKVPNHLKIFHWPLYQ